MRCDHATGWGSPQPAKLVADLSKFASINLVISPNPGVYGQPVTLKATVTAISPGTYVPTGNLIFKDGATSLATVAITGSTATYTTSSLSYGSHVITAQYQGDANFSARTSPATTEVIKIGTTSTITASAMTTTFGTSVTFRVNVAATSSIAGTPTENVVLKDGAAVLTTLPLVNGTANFATTNLSRAVHSMKFEFTGSGNFASSTSPVVTVTVR